MRLLKVLLSLCYYVSIIVGIVSLAILLGMAGVKTYEIIQNTKNQEDQLNELYRNHVYLLSKIDKNEEVVIDLIRPTYEYLATRTVYLMNKISENKGTVGTGVVVKKDLVYTYILTNKHVCDTNKNMNCYILHNNFKIKLEFVKQTESSYDLALWRTRARLSYYKVINGLSVAYPGEKIYTVGHRFGYPFVYGEGVFAGYAQEYVLMQVPVYNGNSGSGIFDKYGNLVALVFGVQIGKNLGFGPIALDTHALCVNGDVLKMFLAQILDN